MHNIYSKWVGINIQSRARVAAIFALIKALIMNAEKFARATSKNIRGSGAVTRANFLSTKLLLELQRVGSSQLPRSLCPVKRLRLCIELFGGRAAAREQLFRLSNEIDALYALAQRNTPLSPSLSVAALYARCERDKKRRPELYL